MPTYAFLCPGGHQFEKFEKMSAKGTAKCPTCGKAARRVISGGAGFVFKGSGFYQTDYKAKGEVRSEKGDATTSKPEPKSDAPAAEKPKADKPKKAGA